MSKILLCEICGTPTRSRRARFCDDCRPLPRPKRGAITETDFIVQDRGFTSPCWIWKGRNPNNPYYGKMRVGGKEAQAHVVSYEQVVGPVPEGMELDHLCRVKRCINPAHLEPVTRAENIQRGSHARPSKEIVREIRASSESSVALAKRLNVHPETIRYARRGQTWRKS